MIECLLNNVENGSARLLHLIFISSIANEQLELEVISHGIEFDSLSLLLIGGFLPRDPYVNNFLVHFSDEAFGQLRTLHNLISQVDDDFLAEGAIALWAVYDELMETRLEHSLVYVDALEFDAVPGHRGQLTLIVDLFGID